MPTYSHGRHEHGQNFLTHRPTLAKLSRLVADTSGPIIEIGPGSGSLTVELLKLGRPLTAIEIDPRQADTLMRKFPRATIVVQDFLTFRLPQQPHVLVGNLPFHLTTAILRRILHAPGWTDAILLTQWEVARRRASVGSATMMTTQWAPWFDFSLHGRVPASAFTPRPGIDGGILKIHRRAAPLLPCAERRQFQALVHRVYTGPGRGLAQILARTTSLGSTKEAGKWLARHGLSAPALPGQMPPDAWADLYRASGSSPPRRRSRDETRRKQR